MELFKEAGGAFKKNNNKAFTRNIYIKQNEINDIIKSFNNIIYFILFNKYISSKSFVIIFFKSSPSFFK